MVQLEALAGQIRRQEPQFIGSVERSTHVPSHSVWPATSHVSGSIHVCAPRSQSWPVGQATAALHPAVQAPCVVASQKAPAGQVMGQPVGSVRQAWVALSQAPPAAHG